VAFSYAEDEADCVSSSSSSEAQGLGHAVNNSNGEIASTVAVHHLVTISVITYI